MASKTIVTLEDDLDGSVAAQTVQFALDGTSWEIDLSDDNAGKLRASIAAYVEKARRVGGRQQRAASVSKTSSPIDNKAVRSWAASNGIEVSSRGRISAEVVEQYRAAGN